MSVRTIADNEARLRLADRYAELGLVEAARALLLEIVGVAPEARAAALLRLGRLASAEDPARAVELARRARAEQDGPAAQLCLGDAALAAGDEALAAESYGAVLARPAAPADRARAQVSLAAVARERGDVDGAARHLVAALDDPALPPELLEGIVELCGEARLRRPVLAALEQPAAAQAPRLRLLRALLLAAADDAAAERALEELSAEPLALLALAVRWARRRGRDEHARAQAIAALEQLLRRDLAGSGVSPARVRLLLGSILDDDPAQGAAAAEHYRAALAALPRDAQACNNLGVIALRAGALEEARTWFVRALVNDPLSERGHLNLARLVYVAGTPARMLAIVEELLAQGLEAQSVANLCFALVEVARADAHQGMADKGHQLKNLIGVAASRMRSSARRAEGDLRARLEQIGSQLAALYEQWAVYLRTMGEEVLAVEPISINELVAQAAHQAGGPVKLRLAARLPEIAGVRDQLHEALVNLMRNAVESQPDGGPIAAETRLAPSGSAVQVIITDRGPGIPAADLRRVFAPGYTTKRSGGGVGLSISERVVRAHDGQLQIESTAGVGTRVCATLPLHLESEARLRWARAPFVRVAGSASAEEYVVED